MGLGRCSASLVIVAGLLGTCVLANPDSGFCFFGHRDEDSARQSFTDVNADGPRNQLFAPLRMATGSSGINPQRPRGTRLFRSLNDMASAPGTLGPELRLTTVSS